MRSLSGLIASFQQANELVSCPASTKRKRLRGVLSVEIIDELVRVLEKSGVRA
jgi:hypothetical protein